MIPARMNHSKVEVEKACEEVKSVKRAKLSGLRVYITQQKKKK